MRRDNWYSPSIEAGLTLNSACCNAASVYDEHDYQWLQDSEDNTALHSAIRLGNRQLVDVLIDDTVMFNFQQVNGRGFNVLQEAAFNNNCQLVHSFTNCSADTSSCHQS